jgi:hypothetical protein
MPTFQSIKVNDVTPQAAVKAEGPQSVLLGLTACGIPCILAVRAAHGRGLR